MPRKKRPTGEWVTLTVHGWPIPHLPVSSQRKCKQIRPHLAADQWIFELLQKKVFKTLVLTQIFCSSIKTAGPQVPLFRETVCLWHLNKSVNLRNGPLSSMRFYSELLCLTFNLQTFLNSVFPYMPYSDYWVYLLVNVPNSTFFLCKPIVLCKRDQKLLSFHWNQDEGKNKFPSRRHLKGINHWYSLAKVFLELPPLQKKNLELATLVNPFP